MRLKFLAALSVMMIASGAMAARMVGSEVVNLPYTVNDNSGSQWMIYQGGWMRQQGNMPVYAQAGMLLINGAGIAMNTNQARIDQKNGDLIFENLSAAGVTVTRRIHIDKKNNYVRYIEVMKNPNGQDMSVNVQLTTNFNYPIQSSQDYDDPQKKDHVIAWTAQMQVGRTVIELYAGKGARTVPAINGQPNNNVVLATAQLTIPAGKEIALVHLHAVVASQDAATQFLSQLKDSDFLSDVPPELRKILVNVSPAQTIGDREILRGDLFDVIELRGGDQMKGTIGETSYKLDTFYGPVELPAQRVVGLINVGQFKPRQLLVTVDGEIFGGTLGKDSIAIQLSSGQTTQVPLAQIARLGYRKRPGEPDEWTFDHPMIALHSGERMMVAMPTTPIDVMTRYGSLKLSPAAIATIVFESPDTGVHQILLTDGSKFAGLVTADHFELQLTGTATAQNVSFPAAAISRFQFTTKLDDPDNDDPILQLSNQDQLIGTLDGQLKLNTAFDTITINASELRGLTHLSEAGLDVQVTLWDQTTLSGQLADPQVMCNLKSGVAVKIPLSLIDHYTNPQPQPSAMMMDRIKAVAADLSADDWKQRERAQSQLVSMGPIVVGVLKQMSGSVPPEAQQRIDAILKQLEKKSTGSSDPQQ